MDTWVVVGWPECRYYQKAVASLQKRGQRVIALNEREYGLLLLNQIPTWKGNSMKNQNSWRSPHIFKYIGGANDLETYLGETRTSTQGCREILGKIIC